MFSSRLTTESELQSVQGAFSGIYAAAVKSFNFTNAPVEGTGSTATYTGTSSRGEKCSEWMKHAVDWGYSGNARSSS